MGLQHLPTNTGMCRDTSCHRQCFQTGLLPYVSQAAASLNNSYKTTSTRAYILQYKRKILSTSGGQWDNPKGISLATLSFDKHLILKNLLLFKNENIENNNNRKHLFRMIYNIKKKSIALDGLRKSRNSFCFGFLVKFDKTRQKLWSWLRGKEVDKIKNECWKYHGKTQIVWEVLKNKISIAKI